VVTVEPARSRGVVLSLVGMVGLAARELFAISAAHALVDTGRGTLSTARMASRWS
jgi:hypothetical protein